MVAENTEISGEDISGKSSLTEQIRACLSRRRELLRKSRTIKSNLATTLEEQMTSTSFGVQIIIEELLIRYPSSGSGTTQDGSTLTDGLTDGLIGRLNGFQRGYGEIEQQLSGRPGPRKMARLSRNRENRIRRLRAILATSDAYQAVRGKATARLREHYNRYTRCQESIECSAGSLNKSPSYILRNAGPDSPAEGAPKELQRAAQIIKVAKQEMRDNRARLKISQAEFSKTLAYVAEAEHQISGISSQLLEAKNLAATLRQAYNRLRAVSMKLVPIEQQFTERAVVDPTPAAREIFRREQSLVLSYAGYLTRIGRQPVRYLIRPKGESKPIFCDLYDPQKNQLIEAKASINRESIRMAIGQLLDYSRFIRPRPSAAVLLPSRPGADLEELLATQEISLIWQCQIGFADNAGGRFL
jgi:hypothetical protein